MTATAHHGKQPTHEQAKAEAGTIPRMVACPECGVPAVIEWTDVLGSTDGPVEHAKVVCANRHRFLMPTERLYRI